jgi:hypothetical protein
VFPSGEDIVSHEDDACINAFLAIPVHIAASAAAAEALADF